MKGSGHHARVVGPPERAGRGICWRSYEAEELPDVRRDRKAGLHRRHTGGAQKIVPMTDMDLLGMFTAA